MDGIRVECYAGYRGEEEPRTLQFAGKRIELVEILERWRAPDGRRFRARGADGAIYLLRHHERRGWSLERPPR